MKRCSLVLGLLLMIVFQGLSQTNDSLFSRLSGIRNNGTDFYHIDGMEISVQTQETEFSIKNILKKFKRYSVKARSLIHALMPADSYPCRKK